MKRFLCLFLALTFVFLLTACGSAPQTTSEKEKITFVLDWTPNTNHTGVYVAIANGYFEEAGLDVEVVQPPEGGSTVLVASGNAQFAVTAQDSIAPALVGNDALPITAVAAILQHNTSGIVSRAGEGMDTPKGLEGHKYATWDSPAEKATIRQVMEADGGDFDNVDLIPSTVTDEVSALQSRSVDAIWIFYGWAGIACEVAGLDIDYFDFADFDPILDFYTPIIVAGNDWLEQNPDTAKAFLAALSKGYAYAVENPKEAADILMEAAPELKSNTELVYRSQEYLAGEYISDAQRWGEFDANRWGGYFRWLNDNGLMEDSLDPAAGFTNAYLPE